MRKQVQFEQGSNLWLKWRRNRVCASDTAIILGISQWSTPYKLWCQKLGLEGEEVENFAMSEGKRLEPEALAAFNLQCSDDPFVPMCFENTEYPWLGASLDGWNDKHASGVEIKCSSKLLEMGLAEIIPEIYICQMQTQMLVTDTDECFYFPYFDKKGIPLECKRDIHYGSRILKASKEFWDKIQNLEPPELTDKDYITRDDLEWKHNALDYILMSEQRKYYEAQEKRYRDKLIEISEKKSTQGCGIRLSRIIRKGNIDYEKLCNDHKLTNIEAYRKAPIESFRIGEIKECNN